MKKKKRFTEEQIIAVLKEKEAGVNDAASTGLRCDSLISRCEDIRQMKEANHSRWVRDDPLATGSIDGPDDVGGRLKLIRSDGEHVGHPVYNKSHRLSVHLHHHDRTALGRLAWPHPKFAGQIDRRNDGPAQVDHAENFIGRVWQWRRGRPSANFANGRRLNAECLLAKLECNDVQRRLTVHIGAQARHQNSSQLSPPLTAALPWNACTTLAVI